MSFVKISIFSLVESFSSCSLELKFTDVVLRQLIAFEKLTYQNVKSDSYDNQL